MSWRRHPQHDWTTIITTYDAHRVQPQARHAATAQAEGRFLHSQVSWTDERAPARNAC